jgi:glycosyltransferase involved in cell wall biosynthesis
MRQVKCRAKILMLLENHPYNQDMRVKFHAEALAEKGFQVLVVSPHGKKESWIEVQNGVTIYHFPAIQSGIKTLGYFLEYGYGILMISLMTAWLVVTHKIDIISVANPPDTLFVAALFPKILGRTFIFDLRDPSPELYLAKFGSENKDGLLYRTLVWLESCACHLSDYIITVNDSVRRIIIERHKLHPRKVTVIRQGPDFEIIRPSQPVADLRARAGTILAYLGNMSYQDGVDHLLYALHELIAELGYRDWFCVLIGNVDDLTSLTILARKLGIADQLWFTGYLPFEKWVPLISTADICIEPAPANAVNLISTMNKLMDYMALKKPFVVYDLPEHHVTAASSALYAHPNDPKALARLIAYLIDRPDLREELGSLGRNRIEQSLAWPFQRNHLLDLYNRIVSLLGAVSI